MTKKFKPKQFATTTPRPRHLRRPKWRRSFALHKELNRTGMLKEQSRNARQTSKFEHIIFSGNPLKWHSNKGWNFDEQDHLPDQQSKHFQIHEDIHRQRRPNKTENWLPQFLFFSHPNGEDIHATTSSNSNLPLVTSEPRSKKPYSCSNRWNNISSCHRKDISASSKKSSFEH